MSTTRTGLRLTEEEKQRYARDGYLLRERVFADEDIRALAEAGEAVVKDLASERTGSRARAGSYVFEPDATKHVVIKWEGDSDVVLGIEPLAHLHETFQKYAVDARFVEPMKDLVGADAVDLFTEKLNLKRAEVGSAIPPHQDYPYWVNASDEVDRIVTAVLALDDATVQSGCLEVVPRSHTVGVLPGRTDDPGSRNEMDPAAFDANNAIPVEMPKGSLLFFGPLLAHRSAPNRSPGDRRALLLSYQPAGNRHVMEHFRRLGL